MNVLQHDNYRGCLEELIAVRKKSVPGFTMGRLADRCNIQRTYLSHVLAGRADFSSDQLYSVCKVFNLPDHERQYLLLLLQAERCQIPERKSELLDQLQALKSVHSDTEKAIGYGATEISDRALAAYYSNPLCSLVHMMLNVPAFRGNVKKIGEQLHLSREALQSVLGVLEECGLVAVTQSGIELRASNIHIRQDHPLSKSHALNFRNYAIQHFWSARQESDYQFTATVAADTRCQEEFRKDILAAISRLSTNVQALSDAGTDQVFQINIDLFTVTVP